ncbi:MAG: hypothetical protein IPG71_04460 [bacterium]|nr:hypothetical protein [bacterium]
MNHFPWYRILPMVAYCLFCVDLPLCYALSPHGDMLQDCNACHTVSDWTSLQFPLAFQHDTTTFPLVGRHVGVSCQSCHTSLVFAEAQTACASCHSDIHSGQLGLSCDQCHDASGWDERMVIRNRHDELRFPLTGRHAQIDCQACHADGDYASSESACIACHQEDYETTQNPSHVLAGISFECASCHSTEFIDWSVPGYAHTSVFPLTGGHHGVQCASCHSEQQYAATSAYCFDCHKEDYDHATAPSHQAQGYPENCLECHTTANWESEFDHQQTVFPLTGQHATTSCGSCHNAGEFAGLAAGCWSCHVSDYQATDEPDHDETQLPHDCAGCHTAQSWSADFDHDVDTEFDLTGGHLLIGCKECHHGGMLDGTPSQCIDCHLSDYNVTTDPDHDAAQLSTACLECHTTDNWRRRLIIERRRSR